MEPREHRNDMPGDLAGEDTEDLAGGFGVDNPDLNPDAMVDAVWGDDVIGPDGEEFTAFDQMGGTTAGTSYADGTHDGVTVDPRDLLPDEEELPG